MRRQRRAALGDQRDLVGVDRLEAEALDPVDRRVEPDRADDMRRPRLEPRRRVEDRSISANVTVSIIAPPPCHGGIDASSSARPHRQPIPVGP